jgi:rubrerythrin
MEKSIQNLKAAFAGESQANRKYLAFAEKAEKEGYPQVARLFRATAEAETVHAMNHLKALKAIGATVDNLKEAISGETTEFREMYPGMIAAAQAEGHREALRSFEFANEVEKVHAQLFQKALTNLEKKELVEVYVCTICGYTVEGEPPEQCPICNSIKKFFKKID